MFSDTLFQGTGCLTHIYFTTWKLYHTDNIFLFSGNKDLNVNGFSIGGVVNRLKVFGVLTIYAGSTQKVALKRFSSFNFLLSFSGRVVLLSVGVNKFASIS